MKGRLIPLSLEGHRFLDIFFSLSIKVPLCQFCAFSLLTVPCNGQKIHLGTKILKKSVLFLTEEGACFTLKMTLFSYKKGALLGVEILGVQTPGP